MTEYIDKQELIKSIVNTPLSWDYPVTPEHLTGSAKRQNEILTLIDDMPAADVRENVKGTWIKDTSRDADRETYGMLRCSILCRHSVLIQTRRVTKMNAEDDELYGELYPIRCRHCKYWKADADRDGVESSCKRIDHKLVKCAKPWFKSYHCGEQHEICRDFDPDPKRSPRTAELWPGFDRYIDLKTDAGDMKEPLRPVWFCLNNDFGVRYGVDYWDFVDGTMIKDGCLMCKKKMYYKINRKNPIGYDLITEDTEPVRIKEVKDE